MSKRGALNNKKEASKMPIFWHCKSQNLSWLILMVWTAGLPEISFYVEPATNGCKNFHMHPLFERA